MKFHIILFLEIGYDFSHNKLQALVLVEGHPAQGINSHLQDLQHQSEQQRNELQHMKKFSLQDLDELVPFNSGVYNLM